LTSIGDAEGGFCSRWCYLRVSLLQGKHKLMPVLRYNGPRSVALAAGMVVTAIGATVLTAWYARFTALVQVVPSLAPMHHMTALSAALCGAALIFIANGRKRAAAICAAASFLIAALVCAEYTMDSNFGIDVLLGDPYINTRSSSPGRMSPISSACYLGYSLAVLALCTPRLSRFSSAIAGVAGSGLATIGVVSFVNLVAHRNAYSWGGLTSISLPSAVSFAFLGCGLLAIAREERPATRSEWLPVGVGIGVAAAVLGIWQALVEREESDLPLISAVILTGGLLVALLLALAVYQAQRARAGSEALRQSEQRFRGVFENSPLGLVLVYSDYRFMKVNDSMSRMLGYSQNELEQMSLLDLTYPEDLAESNRLAQRLLKGEIPLYSIEKRYVKKTGEVMWATLTATVIRDGEGRVLYSLGIIEDITARKRDQEALRQSEERFRGVFENSPLGLALIQRDYQLAKVNESLCRMSGYSEAELFSLNPLDFTYPDDLEESARLAEALFNGEIPSYQVEKRYLKKNGEIMWVTLTATILRDREGRPAYGLGMIEDITERKRDQEALRESEERFRGLFEQSPIGVTLMTMDYRMIRANAAFCRMLGYSEAELTQMTALDFTLPDDRGPTVSLAGALFTQGVESQKLEKRYVTKSGEVIWGRVNASVIQDRQGRPVYGMGMIEDITERKRAEEALRVLSQRLSVAVRSAAMGVWDWDARTEMAVWNERMFQIFDMSPKGQVGREEWVARIHPDDLPRIQPFIAGMLDRQTADTVEFRIILPNGSVRHISSTGNAVVDDKGKVNRLVGVTQDITERKQAEQRLAEQAALLDLAHDAIFARDLEGRITFWSRSARDTYGWTAEEAQGVESNQLLQTQFPVPEQEVLAAVRAWGGWEGELVHTKRSGKKVVMASRWSLERDAAGAPQAILEINRDITSRKQMEEQIEASREQMAAAARLSALGMMAGGVAHEINNPLAIIHALASDLLDTIEEHGSVPPEVVARSSRQIRETAQRIAGIVKSLRKISREGPKERYYPVRIGKILQDTLEISRARFAARSVKLILPASIPDLSISCREVQIEQVLLNLLQNAFDAVVDEKGERWVRVDVATKDGAAVVSVSDSGPGIPAELRDHIGQPFFTTKEVGKGTGLGLSLSKTIAEEHGGRVVYDEQEGHTRFSLVLPLARQAEAA
jgi:PAS domain S-box-containing protein